MKMSDVFYLPLKQNGNSIADGSGDQVSDWGFDKEEFDEAAIHAINQHDQLVELNKELMKALGEYMSDCGVQQGSMKHDGIRALVERAKELNQ